MLAASCSYYFVTLYLQIDFAQLDKPNYYYHDFNSINLLISTIASNSLNAWLLNLFENACLKLLWSTYG